MAENLIVNKGNKARLNEIPILAGAITAIIDARELYIDYGDDNPEYRVKITDVEVIDADSKDLSSTKIGANPVPNPIADKLYCFTKSQDIWTYLDTNKMWIKVGGTKNSAFALTTGLLTDEANISTSSLVNMSGTKVNLSEVSVGSLIVDGNYSVGIVKAINGSTVAVKRLVDNKKTNTLTQHIYIDSAYDGVEVGTIEKPFKSFANLMAVKSDYLKSNDKKVIHLISDNCSINTTTAINNCEFISESYSFEHEFKLTGNNTNLTLSNCTITDYFDIKANKVRLNNCNLKSARGEEAKIKTNLLKALNVHSELSEPLKLYSYNNADAEFNFYNSNMAEVQLSDAAITTVNFNSSRVSLSQASGITYKYNLNLTDTEVYYLRNLTTTGNIYFYSGTLRSETNQPTIKATDIYLGAFDFGLLVPIFNGNIIKQSGITSKQVFDTKVRTYGNDDVNLEAHLDAIDNKFKDIDSELHGGSESNVNLGEAFISANTFDSPEVLLNASYRTGDVVKYTGYGTAELTNEFVLTVSDDENAIEQINVTNVGEDGLTTSIPHTSVKFDMENSKFFAKLFDTISVRYNSTIDDENPAIGNNYSMLIYSIGPDWIKARIANTELFDTFDNKRYFTACNYIQTIEVGPSDRILRLSNGWDKLSASNGESGNYHIVQAFNDLYGIETEDTRKVGTLAYVQDDELMYIWKVVNAETGVKNWEEWSGGGSGGGASRARISQYGNVSIYRDDNSPIDIQIQVSGCTTGILTAEYQFVGNPLTKRSVSVNVERIGVHDIKLTNIANQTGMLNVSVSFRSTDPNIASAQESVNISFYIGNLLAMSNLYINELLSVGDEDKYNVNTAGGTTLIPAYNVKSYHLEDVNELTIKYNVLTYRTANFNAYFTLYKGKNKVAEFVSEAAKISGSYEIYLPTEDAAGNSIEYTPGLYKLEAYCKDDLYTSQIVTYDFILESNSIINVTLLNEDNISVAPTENVNLQYIVITKRTSQDSLTIVPHMIDNQNNDYVNMEEGTEITITCDKAAKNVSFAHSGQLGNTYNCYLTAIPAFTGAEQADSEKITVLCILKDYMNIVNESTTNLIFNLDSTNKSNNTASKAKWNSVQVTNDDVYGTLHNFSYYDNGWIRMNVDDNNIGKFGDWKTDQQTILKSDGYSSYATININPLYKYNDTNIFDYSKGYTFEIKFKYNELYTDASIVECVDEANRGFIIKGNEVIFSPYASIDSATKENAVSTRLTADTWHTITLVLAVKATDTYYGSKMFNHEMTGDSVAILYVDGVISGIVSGGQTKWYSENTNNDRFITLFGKYDFTNKLVSNYAKGEIMHVRLYNSALTDNQVLNNYIASVHNLDNQNLLKTFNDFNKDYSSTKIYEGFGQLPTDQKSIPVLKISNANLAALDSIMGPNAKNYVFPNCGLELSYNGITLMKKYGCVVKVQGTSSTNYAIKNYKITWYNFDEEMPNEKIYSGTPYNPSAVSSYDTLVVADDNYKRVKKDPDGVISKYNKKLAVSINGWLPENTFTLKADYMDSSHTHNTGTAHFVNEYMSPVPPQLDSSPYNNPDKLEKVSLSIDDIKVMNANQAQYDTGKQVNRADKVQQAIEGFPILIEYSYYDGNGELHQEQKGIYQFNVDKNSPTIFGYDEYGAACKSYEISNNSTMAGAAGFNVDILNPNESTGDIRDNDLYMVKQDFEIRHHPYEELSEDDMDMQIEHLIDTYSLTENDIEKFIAADEKSGNLTINVSSLTSDQKTALLEEYNTTNIHSEQFGYIASQPTATSIKLEYNKFALNPNDETLRIGLTSPLYTSAASDSNCHTNDELLNLLIWMHDCKVDSESAEPTNKFYNEFSQHFDLDNMSKYILLVRTLGMADNLAKNMMITTWNATDENIVYTKDTAGVITGIDYSRSTFCKWYLQFYDLDTSIGLDNVGNNTYNTSLDIYGHSRSEDLILEDGYNNSDATDITEQTYTASSSTLWKLILDNFGRLDYSGSKSGGNYQIQGNYNMLRSNVLTPEKLKNNFFDNITDKIGQYYFNLDALNKYFGYNFALSSDAGKYFYMCQGKAKEHMSDFIDKRFIYTDSLFGYDNGMVKERPVTTGSVTGNLFVQVKAPMYMPAQFADVNILEHAQLGTAKFFNRIPATFENDANVIIYQVKNILALRNLAMFNFRSLDLSDATSLIELNCSELPDLQSLNVGSKILQNLNLSNSKLTAVDVSELENLIELDISNSNIETLTLRSSNSAASNIIKLNVKNSKLNDLDFSALTSLESFGKVSMSRTYDSLMSLLTTYKLMDSSNEAEYIQKLTNQFKSFLTPAHLTALNEWMRENNIANDAYPTILKQIMSVYRADLGEQYIPGLAIYEITADSSTKTGGFNNIKFNSNKIRAIILTSNVSASPMGKGDGSIIINSEELRYLKIVNCDISTGTVTINNPKLEEVIFTTWRYYTGDLDLSKADSLSIINFTSLNELTKIIVSPVVRTADKLHTLILSNINKLSWFIDSTEEYADDANVLNFTGLTLNKLNLENSLYFKQIKGMNAFISAAGDVKFNVTKGAKADNRTGMLYTFSNNYTVTASFTDSQITLKNKVSLSSIFIGRLNMVFNSANLKINNLKYATDINSTFDTCCMVDYNWVTYIMSNITTNCTSASYAFAGCYNINFPNSTVPATLFGDNCTGLTNISCMFGNIGRRYHGGSSRTVSLTLANGLFDKLTNLTNLAGVFSNCLYELTPGSDTQTSATYTTYNVSNESRVDNTIHIYSSYVSQCNIDIFDKLTKLTSDGLGLKTHSIFKGTESQELKITRTNRNGVTNSTRDFNTMFRTLTNVSDFTNAFTKTKNIKIDGNSVQLNNKLFATGITPTARAVTIVACFASMNPNLSINFKDILKYVSNSNGFSCTALFSKYKKAFNFNDIWVDTENLRPLLNPESTAIVSGQNTPNQKITSTQSMFEECTEMTGYLLPATKITTSDDQKYTVISSVTTNGQYRTFFTNQTLLETTAGMFYGCSKFGGLLDTTWGEGDTIESQKPANDLPVHMFKTLTNLKNTAHMFNGCSNLNIMFDDLYKVDIDTQAVTKEYLFDNCKSLSNVAYMFANCPKLNTSLPAYGCPGSNQADVSYFYYDITAVVKAWLNTLTPVNLRYTTEPDTLLSYQTIDGEKYDPFVRNEFGDLEYNADGTIKCKDDEVQYRIYDLERIYNSSVFSSNADFSLTYLDIVKIEGEETQYTFYQYYKTCNINKSYTVNGEAIKPLYEGDKQDRTKNHTDYILEPGFFYTGTAVSPLKLVSHCFTNCVNLKGQIPPNLFRTMSNVTSLAGIFSGCTSLGLTSAFTAEMARAANNDHELTVSTIPYMYPFGLLDDMSSLDSLASAFYKVRYLSRPYHALTYSKSIELEGVTIDAVNKQYGEKYALPKYFLYFNPLLTNCNSTFRGADRPQELFGDLYPNMFLRNKNITDLGYTFAYSGIRGSKSTTDNSGNTTYYIGADLLRPLSGLSDCSGLFQHAQNIKQLINPATRDLLFTSAVHSKGIKTVNLIDQGANESYGPWYHTFSSTVKGKIVLNSNASSFDSDYQCYQYFTSVSAADTLVRYS